MTLFNDLQRNALACIVEQLNHWRHMDYFKYVLTKFLCLDCSYVSITLFYAHFEVSLQKQGMDTPK